MSLATGRPTVAIVNALPVENAAQRLLTDDLLERRISGDPNYYQVGSLPSADAGTPHRVVVAMLGQDGTRNAAALCTDLLRSFPTVRCVILSGVAGGVPAPQAPDRHVRLGDVVVATDGVVDLGHVRTVDGVDVLRRATEGLSHYLLRAERELQVRELRNVRPWEAWLGIPNAPVPPGFSRPPEQTDVLYVGGRPVEHPPAEPRGMPRIHRGAIGSADRLLRDAVKRDELAGRYHVRALEMEASGIAASSALRSVQWFVVRGIADYCDNATKNDRWHPYASLASAAYVRALLASCRPLAGQDDWQAGPAASSLSFEDVVEIADALLTLEQFRDDYDRRAVMTNLPAEIRANIADSPRARLHVIAMVRTCAEFDHGKEALLGALRAAAPGSSAMERAAATIAARWPG